LSFATSSLLQNRTYLPFLLVLVDMSSEVPSVYWAANLESDVLEPGPQQPMPSSDMTIEEKSSKSEGQKEKKNKKKKTKKEKKKKKKKERKKKEKTNSQEGMATSNELEHKSTEKSKATGLHNSQTPSNAAVAQRGAQASGQQRISPPKLVKFDLTAPSSEEASQPAPVPKLVAISLSDERDLPSEAPIPQPNPSPSASPRQHERKPPRPAFLQRSVTIHGPAPTSPRPIGDAHKSCVPVPAPSPTRHADMQRVQALALAKPTHDPDAQARANRTKPSLYNEANDLLVIAGWRKKLVRAFRRLERELGTNNCDIISRAEAIELFHSLGWTTREGGDDDVTVYHESNEQSRSHLAHPNRAKAARRSVPGLERLSVAAQCMNARKVLTPQQVSGHAAPTLMLRVLDEILDCEGTGYVDLQSMCDFVNLGVGELLMNMAPPCTGGDAADAGPSSQLPSSKPSLGLAGRFFRKANERRMSRKDVREVRSGNRESDLPEGTKVHNTPPHNSLVVEPANEYSKNTAWREAVDESLDKLRREIEAQSASECTFQPHINSGKERDLAARYWKRRIGGKSAVHSRDRSSSRPQQTTGSTRQRVEPDSQLQDEEREVVVECGTNGPAHAAAHHWTQRLSQPRTSVRNNTSYKTERVVAREGKSERSRTTGPASCLVTNPRAHERHRSAMDLHVQRLRGGTAQRHERRARYEKLGVPTKASWAKSVAAFEAGCDESPHLAMPLRARARLGICNGCDPVHERTQTTQANAVDTPAIVANIQFRSDADGFNSEPTWYGSVPLHVGDNPFEVAFRFALRNALSHAQHNSLEASLLHVMSSARLLKSRVRPTQITQARRAMMRRAELRRRDMSNQRTSSRGDEGAAEQSGDGGDECEGVVESKEGDEEVNEKCDEVNFDESERVKRWANWWKTYRAQTEEIHHVTGQVESRAVSAGWDRVAAAARAGHLVNKPNKQKQQPAGPSVQGEQERQQLPSSAWRGLFEGVQG
jgi:hypothetical protein